MIPFRWHADEQGRAVFDVAAIARDLDARRLLAPTPDHELAALIDQSLTQFAGDVASSIARTAAVLFGGLPGDADPVVESPFVLMTRVNPSPISTLVQDQQPDVPQRGVPLASVPGLQVEIFATDIIIDRGSVIAKVAGAMFGTGAPVAALLFLLAPDYAEWRSERLANYEIIRVTDGRRCSVEFASELRIQELRHLAVDALLSKNATSPVEARRRACLIQVLLHLNGAYAGVIDGIEGPMTRKAEKAFAAKVGLTDRDVDTVPFYQALLAGVQPKR